MSAVIIQDPDSYSLEDQVAFVSLSKEAKMYKILYEVCLKQLNNNIEIARRFMKEDEDISAKGSLLIHLDVMNTIHEIKEKLEKGNL